MPRGQRKSTLEKLQMELTDTKDSIKQYESCLITMRQKEVDLEKQIKMEECKEVASILDESGISIEELKYILQEKMTESINEQEQSA